MDSIVIKNSRWLYFVFLIASFGFVVVGIWMIFEGIMLGWVSIAFFGSGALIFIWQIFDSRPRLIIDSEGITDRTLGVGKIVWADIEDASIKSIQGTDFICLKLVDPEKYLGRLSKVGRGIVDINRSLGFTESNLNLSGVQANTQEVFEPEFTDKKKANTVL
jgi:hypothetical protein